ncbi:MAG TPA: trigger factor family protein, partial [Phycisphaerales bacterium]|nr:trigger factor family protein [Phycisphaerales bacterium]
MAKSKSGSKSADTGTGAVVEDIGPSRKKITITIPGDEVSQTLDASLATVTAEAVLPGFRPGRVPARLIEKRFGGAVKDEAKKQLVSTAYSRAVEEHKLRVLGEPEGAEELATLELQPGKEVKFTVEVEVPPTFELPSLDGIPVNRPVIEVQEKDIDAFIDRLKVNEGKLEPREQAEAGDYAIGNGVMKTSDGEVVHDIQGAVIQIPPAEAKGEGAILGVKVDDFGKQVGLPKVGDTLKVKATGPEHHENAKIR